ncbi:MAG TPA: ATP synthase F1 subunit delta [Candidatus Eisenbacteria bacterium]|nr:ATP synthase F1 subunit delta [Candidatus Eisenbacteria bacterium]
MRAQEGTARRYAKALHMAATEAGVGEAAGRELAALLEGLESNRQAMDVLARPWIKPSDRHAAALELAKTAGCGKLVSDFVALVAERGRLNHLAAIVAAYRDLEDATLGRVRASVRRVVALTDTEKTQLSQHLQAALGKQILLDERVDTNLLGGFVAQVGSLILDGSLDGQLARMRERLVRG